MKEVLSKKNIIKKDEIDSNNEICCHTCKYLKKTRGYNLCDNGNCHQNSKWEKNEYRYNTQEKTTKAPSDRMVKTKEIKTITRKEAEPFILNKHYAGRMPSISYSYGLFIDDNIEGILTIGKPASMPLCDGVCGKSERLKVYELNRLIVNDGLEKNTLSWFVSGTLKKLKDQDLIIVSYADEGMNHHGYIYQATNWIYTGKTKERTDKYMPGGKHPRHYTDQHNSLRKCRTSKHRYIYFTDKRKRKEHELQLNYPICEYPKGDNKKYTLGDKIKTKILNSDTGECFYE